MRLLLLACGIAVLPGCGSLLETTLPAPQAYVLRLAPATVALQAANPGSLLVQRPEAGPGLASEHIALLRSGQRFDFYAASRWAAPSPDLVESVLVEHPDVLEAAVVGAADADGLEMTVAFVVARSGRTIDPAAIDVHCRERMAAFKRPRRLVEVAELPKTPTGKIRRFALRERLAAGT